MLTRVDDEGKEIEMWQYPFSKLKRSSDDGSMLKLVFSDNEVKVMKYRYYSLVAK